MGLIDALSANQHAEIWTIFLKIYCIAKPGRKKIVQGEPS